MALLRSPSSERGIRRAVIWRGHRVAEPTLPELRPCGACGLNWFFKFGLLVAAGLACLCTTQRSQESRHGRVCHNRLEPSVDGTMYFVNYCTTLGYHTVVCVDFMHISFPAQRSLIFETRISARESGAQAGVFRPTSSRVSWE